MLLYVTPHGHEQVRGTFPYDASTTSQLMRALQPGSRFFCRFSTFRMPDRQDSPLRLLASLLVYSPAKRATAAQALESSWLENAPTRITKNVTNVRYVTPPPPPTQCGTMSRSPTCIHTASALFIRNMQVGRSRPQPTRHTRTWC